MTDKKGNVSDLFFPSELSRTTCNSIVNKLEKGKTDFYNNAKFKIRAKEIINELPKNITNFKIVTELIKVDK